jgi:hypothetical protein
MNDLEARHKHALETKELLRTRGLWGKITNDQICILPRGHDSGGHDRGWAVRITDDVPVFPRDSRDVTTTYHVHDGNKSFTTPNKEHAEWLASTLTRLDL